MTFKETNRYGRICLAIVRCQQRCRLRLQRVNNARILYAYKKNILQLFTHKYLQTDFSFVEAFTNWYISFAKQRMFIVSCIISCVSLSLSLWEGATYRACVMPNPRISRKWYMRSPHNCTFLSRKFQLSELNGSSETNFPAKRKFMYIKVHDILKYLARKNLEL